jgi:probable rRNA maturation factor
MKISIDVEDERWLVLTDVEAVVLRAIDSVLPDDVRSVDVVLTSDAEIREINREWRGKDKTTNVLSFPAAEQPVPDGEVAHLGDMVLAFETVEREAKEAAKPLSHHVTHLVVHGTLHLLGHDHEDDLEAEAMEAKEKEILAGLGIADPYTT